MDCCTNGIPVLRIRIFPLVYGNPGRVGKLRAYGNAIVPQAAAEFISAYLDAVGRDFLRGEQA